jgi:hypothetical protein
MVIECILLDVQDNHASVWLDFDLRGDGNSGAPRFRWRSPICRETS